MRILQTLLAISCVATFTACGVNSDNQNHSSDLQNSDLGVIGTTCYAEPVIRNSQNLNVCILPDSNWPGYPRGKFFYSAINNINARSQAVQACKSANGLDYGHTAGTGQSCAEACEALTTCLPFTNP